MILGALVDLGGDYAGLRAALDRVARGRFTLRRRRVVSKSLAATKIDVRITGRDARERNFREITQVIGRAGLPPAVKDLAIEIFRRLCQAEAAAHGVSFQAVHLHEAGALDAIADICGAAWLFEDLAAERVVCTPLNVGSGTIECRHGTYPVPGPATTRLLTGVPVYAEGSPGERVTPTGAAILSTVVSEFRVLPSLVPIAVGHGAGDRDFDDRPNVLRAILGEEIEAPRPFPPDSWSVSPAPPTGDPHFRSPTTSAEGSRHLEGRAAARKSGAGPPASVAGRHNAHAAGRQGDVVVIETTIDDMNPQNYGFLLDRALAAGALEIYFTPILMKKERPGVQVTALVSADRFETLSRLIFQETSTIGFRYRTESRRELDRALIPVTTPYGRIRLKVSSDHGEVLQVQPEFDDCRAIADSKKIPLKEVQRAALAAWKPPPRPAEGRIRRARPSSRRRRGSR